MRLFYSQTERPTDGAQYRNPRFFAAVEQGVEAVTVHGDFPAIALAYTAAGVPVTVLGAVERAQAYGGGNRNHPPGGITITPPSQVHIPDDWRSLPWTAPAEQLCLRQLAALVSDQRVTNKREAIAAVEAYLGVERAEGNEQ